MRLDQALAVGVTITGILLKNLFYDTSYLLDAKVFKRVRSLLHLATQVISAQGQARADSEQ